MSSSPRDSRLPIPITEQSPVLDSHIPLPALPSIAYAKFIPIQRHEYPHKAVELARQRIINGVRRRGKSIEESLLPIVHIGKDEATLWVFSIRSLVHNQEHSAGGKGKQKVDVSIFRELDELVFDSLQRCDLSQFTPSALYPCSSECAKLADPCSYCTSVLSTCSTVRGDTFPSSSSATLFPRLSLRTIYTLFIDAVRDRLIDDICIGPHHPPEEPTAVTRVQVLARTLGATRLGRGFLSNGQPVFPTWGYGWEQRSHTRPLLHTSLDVYVSPTAIHIRPLPTLTRLIPVPVWCTLSSRPTKSNSTSDSMFNSPPLTPGTPLILAPYSTPAFYVSAHAGTSIPNTLRAQFWEALSGLGVVSFLPNHSKFSSCYPSFPSATSPSASLAASLLPTEPFVLALIPLLNPQGEPKVVTALWPTRLSFIDTSPNRFHLTSLPEIPGTEVLLTPPRGAGAQPSDQTPCPASPLPLVRRRSYILAPLENLSRAQRAFRALELSSHKRIAEVQLLGTAKTTAGYVESVAKERERERERAIQERIRREREAKEGKSTSGTLAPAGTSSNAVKLTPAVSDAARMDSGSPKPIVDMARPGSSWHSVPTNFFAKAAQDSVVHSFYPSPPDWNPISSSQNSGTSDSSGNIAEVSASSSNTRIPHSPPHSQSASNANQQAIRGGLDISNEIDLGMDIDMNDMGMSINLGTTMGMLDVNMDVNMDATGLMDGGFGSFADPFTDDDFNYFDTAPAPEPIPITQDIQRPLHAEGGMSGWLGNGLEAADQGSGILIPSQLQPVTPASVDATQESLSGLHQMLEDDRELLPPAPDLIPSSPAKTPWSPGSPPTPSLELNVPPASPVGKRMFEPIYFGSRHHVADGKYRDARGKFAFPNTVPRSTSNPESDFAHDISHFDKEDGWKLRYDAITDPRVGVVNRLRGVKRKFHDKAYASKSINGRLRDEEWESVYEQTDDAELPEETSSSEEEDDNVELELEQDQDDDYSPQSYPSRPSTPPPSGLPLTATLLYFHFHHAQLLSLGMPMRPTYGELVSDNHPPPVPISVPTPVSPAAALGNATERSKTLELLAQAIAREAVENHVWAQAWGASLDGPLVPQTRRICHEVSATDLKNIALLVKVVPGLRGPSLLSDILENFHSTTSTPHSPSHGRKLQLLQLPRISIGRAGLVHQMLPTAIRFWEKQGLGPRSGTKDVVAFALFEESDDKRALVDAWMQRVGRAYNTRGFGTHTAGNAGTFRDGLVPVQFDTVRKTLPNLMSVLPEEPLHIVIYIIAPPAVFSSLKSPALRAILTSQRGVSKLASYDDFNQDRVLIHLVPDYCVADPYTYPNTRHVGLELFVNSVYDRLLRATLRQTSRQFWRHNPPFESRLQVPSFTLARNTASQPHFEWDEHSSLNVLDRHTFLHVGYRLSKCKRWLLAACIDERGEAHDVAVWGVPNQTDTQAVVNWVVSNVWTFAKQFAQRADSEWRIVISKLGEIEESEIEVWMSHLEGMVSTHTGPPVHVCLVCAQNDIPFPMLHTPESVNEIKSNTMSHNRSVFSDVSSVTYSAIFLQRMPIISPDLLCPWEHPSLVAPTGSGDDEADALPATGPSASILPLSTAALLRVPNHNTEHTNVEALYIHLLCAYKSAKSTLKQTMREMHADITRNWYDLAVLTRDRWQFSQQGDLPFHLAALESMSNALDPTVLNPDDKDMDYILGS